MRTKKELIEGWIKKAEKDLLTAEHELSFSNPVTESICFHCQQAAEKYLKAYLLFLDIPFIKTHEIGELITAIETKDKEISTYKLNADKLTDYAVEIRYPDYGLEPGLEEAREAFQIANAIKNYITKKIK